MIINTATHSDKNFWFLRGIEDLILQHSRGCGELNTIQFDFSNAETSLRPKAITFLGTTENITAVLSMDYSDRIFLLSGANYTPVAIIDFNGISIKDLTNIGSTIFILTVDGRIMELQIRPSDLKVLLQRIPSSVTHNNVPSIPFSDIASTALTEYHVNNLPLNECLRIVAYHSNNGFTSILAWKDHSPDIWIADLSSYNIMFNSTNLNIKKNILPFLRFACAIYHSNPKSLFLSDAGSARIFYVPLYEKNKPLRAKIVVGNGLKGFPFGRAETAQLTRPQDIAIYDISTVDPSFDEIFKFQVFETSQKKSKRDHRRIPRNPFLIIIDGDNKVAVTLRVPKSEETFNRTSQVLPLIGEFPNITEKESVPVNLAIHQLKAAEKVSLGPEGSLLFWRSGEQKLYQLDPQLRRLLGTNKDRESRLKIKSSPDT